MFWFSKSKRVERVWKEAFKLVNRSQVVTYISDTGLSYKTVGVMRRDREQRQREIAYKIAELDDFNDHPDHYWFEAAGYMVMAYSKERKNRLNRWFR